MAENNLIKDTILLCDNLISEYILNGSEELYISFKNTSRHNLPTDEKTIKTEIREQLTELVKSIDNNIYIEKLYSKKHNCAFIFSQCFEKDIAEIVNNILSIENAIGYEEQKRISKIIANKYQINEDMPPKIIQDILESKKKHIIKKYSKDFNKRITALTIKEKGQDYSIGELIDIPTIQKHLESYTSQKLRHQRRSNYIKRKYNGGFILLDFTENITSICNSKYNIIHSPDEYKEDTARRVRDNIVKVRTM